MPQAPAQSANAASALIKGAVSNKGSLAIIRGLVPIISQRFGSD